MLIGHDAVQAGLIGRLVFFVVLVVEDVGFFRVEVSVGKAKAAGVILL